jgi:hypothetical protein
MTILVNIANEQKFLNDRLTKMLKLRNIEKEKIDKESIYEIEEQTKIGHYKTSISENRRRSHLILSTYSREQLDNDIKNVFD